MATGADAPPIAATFEAIRDVYRVPALAGLMVRDGRVIDQFVVGVRKIGDATPATIDDRFHLGSGTKAMTATLVASMVDEGRLAWTSTLAELLPDIETMDAAYRPVTIGMLLTHRAGLGAESLFDQGRLFARLTEPGLDPSDGRALLARAMLSAPPESAPGSTYAYSNAGYVVVGRILERLSGQSWETLMRSRLFEPLRMGSCGFGPPPQGSSNGVAQPWGHASIDGLMRPVDRDNPATLGPAGTVHCSLSDWMKFVMLHLDASNGRASLLSPASFEMLRTAAPGGRYTYGGWLRVEATWAGGTVFTHDGSNTFNYATVWWAPRKSLAVMAVSNAGIPAGRHAVHDAVRAMLERSAPPR